MKSKIEFTSSSANHYQSWIIATLIHHRKRHQMTWAAGRKMDYATAIAIATPSIEKWEAVILAEADENEA